MPVATPKQRPPGWAPEPAPARPLDFGAGFKLPTHRTRLLQLLHPHARDESIRFEEVTHTYYVTDETGEWPTLGSVTGLAHACSHPFDSDKVIRSMIHGRNWPRLGYFHDLDSANAVDALAQIEAIFGLEPGSVRDEASVLDALTRDTADLAEDQQRRLVDARKALVLEPHHIKQKWKDDAREAANRGTQAHYSAERLANADPVCREELDTPEMRLFQHFCAHFMPDRALEFYRTEWEIYDQDIRLAGSIDCVLKDPATGTFQIVDYKRTKGIEGKRSNRFRKMKPPLDEVEDAQVIQYALQLGIYRWILQRKYDMTVDGLFIVCIHPEHETPYVIDICKEFGDGLEDRVEALIDIQRAKAGRVKRFHESSPKRARAV